MLQINIDEFSPFRHYYKTISTKHFLPPDIQEIRNMKYCITETGLSFFIYTQNGEAIIKTPNGTIKTHPKMLMYFPPNYVIDKYTESADYEYMRLELDIYDIDTKEKIIFSKEPTVILNESLKEIPTILSQLLNITVTTPSDELNASILANKFISAINTGTVDFFRKKTVSPQINKVIQYLKINYMKNESIQTYAKISGLSEPYFRKCFKKITNMTPIEYRNYLKIEKSKELLMRNHHISNDYIAGFVGFDDTNYYSRTFKKFVGMSPQNYLKYKLKNINTNSYTLSDDKIATLS